MQTKFRIPKILFGAMLAVAIFAMGMLVVSSAPSGPSAQNQGAEKTENSSKKSSHPERWWHDPIANFTLGLIIVGLFQAGLFWVQLGLIRKTLGPAQTAAEAAKESADALIAAESARLLIYPKSHSLYESVGKFGVMWNNSPNMGNLSSRPSAVYEFKNYGKTPATLMSASVFLKCHEGEPPKIGGASTSVELPAETVIAGGSSTPEFIIGVDETVTMKDAIAIVKGEKSIWLYGTIAYGDVFDRVCEQQFLFRLHPTNGSFIRYYDRSTYRKTQHYRLEAETGHYG